MGKKLSIHQFIPLFVFFLTLYFAVPSEVFEELMSKSLFGIALFLGLLGAVCLLLVLSPSKGRSSPSEDS